MPSTDNTRNTPRHIARRGGHVIPALLDIAQAAEYLATTERQMRDLRTRREITAVFVGRLLRFRRADLDAYIERNVQPARVQPDLNDYVEHNAHPARIQPRAAPNTRRPPHPKARRSS